MPYSDGEKGEKIPKITDLASTGIVIYARLDNEPRQKYGLFHKLSLAVIGECEAAKNPHIFLTRENQYIQ